MLSFVFIVSLLTFSLSRSLVSAFSATSNTNLAVYWGQGNGQKPLGDFCDDDTIDIIPIAFVNIFPDESVGNNGYPGTDFGNACGGYFTDSNGVQTRFLASCPGIEADILKCQAKGKKILLSLGGDSTQVFVASEQSAIDFANFLWAAFGPVPATSPTNVPRPFGSAVVDGFDFDIESLASDVPNATYLSANYDTVANQLRSNFAQYPQDTFYISAAPQCVIPDAHLATALENSYFDWIFVQFYNTPYCSARAHLDHTYGSSNGSPTDISFAAWAQWTASHAQNKGAKIFLGLPAAPAGTSGSMYLNPSEALEVTADFFSTPSFGGIMLWEATLSENNIDASGNTYAEGMKAGLLSLAGVPGTTSTSSSATTTTTTTTMLGGTSTVSTTSTSFATTSAYLPPVPTSSFVTSSMSFNLSPTYRPTSGGFIPSGPESSQPTPSTSLASPSSTTSWTTTTTSNGIVPVGPESSSLTPVVASSSTPVFPSSYTTTSSYSNVVTPVGPESSPPVQITSAFISSTISSSSCTTTSSTTNGILPVGPESSVPTPIVPASTSSAPSSSISSISTPGFLSSSPSASSSSASSTSSSILSSSSSSTITWQEPTVTVITTSFVDICPTGLTTKSWITTLTETVQPSSTSVGPNSCPDGFTTTVTVCTVCGPAPTTVTLTLPLVEQTMTVQPVVWSEWTTQAAPETTATTTKPSTGWSPTSKAWTTSTSSKSTASVSWAPSTTSSIYIPSNPSSFSSSLTPVAATSTGRREGQHSIYMPPSSSSSSPSSSTTPVIAAGTDVMTYQPTATVLTMGLVSASHVDLAALASTATSSTTSTSTAWAPGNAAPFSPQFTGAANTHGRFAGGAVFGAVAMAGLLL